MSDAFEVSPSTLEVGGITLRSLSVEDAPAVHACATDPEVARFTLWPPHSSIDSTREFLAGLSSPTVVSWAIVLNREQCVVGMVFLHSFSRRHKKAEIAFNVARYHWKKGIATEAAQAVLRFAFEEAALNRVEATCSQAMSVRGVFWRRSACQKKALCVILTTAMMDFTTWSSTAFFAMKTEANKAPEPTPGLVTPRAMESAFEMKRRIENRDAARGAAKSRRGSSLTLGKRKNARG